MSSNKWLHMGEAVANNSSIHLDTTPLGSRSLRPSNIRVILHLLNIAEANARNDNDSSA